MKGQGLRGTEGSGYVFGTFHMKVDENILDVSMLREKDTSGCWNDFNSEKIMECTEIFEIKLIA